MGVHGGYKKVSNDMLGKNRYKLRIDRNNEKIQKDLEKFETMRRNSTFAIKSSNKKSFEKWVEISTKQQNEDTIRNMLIENQDSVCLSYLCHYQKFSENFIEELYWITNRIFTKESFSVELVQKIIEFTDDFSTKEARIKAAKRIKNFSNNKKLNNHPLSEIELKYVSLASYTTKNGGKLLDAMISVFNKSKDRLDWRELNNWEFSQKFRDKYKNEFEVAKLLINNSDYLEKYDSYSIPSPTLY